MVVEPRLLDRVDRQVVPKDDVAVPDAGDDLLDYVLAEKALGIGNGGDLEGVEGYEGGCGVFLFRVVVVCEGLG